MTIIKRKDLIAPNYHILGSFKNEHGEEFIFYQKDTKGNSYKVFFTGHETDWEEVLLSSRGRIVGNFLFNSDEQKEIMKIFSQLNKK